MRAEVGRKIPSSVRPSASHSVKTTQFFISSVRPSVVRSLARSLLLPAVSKTAGKLPSMLLSHAVVPFMGGLHGKGDMSREIETRGDFAAFSRFLAFKHTQKNYIQGRVYINLAYFTFWPVQHSLPARRVVRLCIAA